MNRFVFLNYSEGYQACIVNAIKGDLESSYYDDCIKNSFLKKLFLIHNAWPLNKVVELPFKKIWFKRIIKKFDFQDEDNIYFLLYESFHLTYSISFLKYLRRKFPKAKLCYMFSNPVSEYNLGKINRVRRFLDVAITFNKVDSDKYGFLYCPYQPYKVPFFEMDETDLSDIFFIGSDKGRLDVLLSIFEKLTSEGLVCDFYIVDVPKHKQKYNDRIKYNQRLTYEEVLKKVASTKCVLEILQDQQNYASIRTVEALQYNKKLLTNNITVKEHPLYNDAMIQIVEDYDNINIDFLKDNTNIVEYRDVTFYSIEYFKKFLYDNI